MTPHLAIKLRSILCIVFIFMLFSACNNQTPFDEKGDIYVPERADPKEYSASDLFKEVKYVPLERTKLSDLSNVDKFVHYKDIFIVYCNKANNVFTFDSNSGKFLNKMELPENKAVEIGSFAFDVKNETIIVQDLRSLEFHFFDLTGRFIKSISNAHLDFKDFEYFDNGFIFLMSYPHKQDNSSGEGYKVLITDLNLKPLKKYIKYNKSSIYKNDLYDNALSFFRSSDDHTLRLTIPGEYTVYHFKDKDSYSKQNIYPPKRDQLPNSFLDDKKWNGKRMSYLNREKNKVYSFQDIYFTDSGVTTFRMLSQKNLRATKLMKDSVFIDINNISYPFAFNYALPILGNTFIGSTNNVLYSSIDARFMFEAFYQTGLINKIDQIKDPHLEKYFKTANIHSNPIISVITLK